VRTVDGNKINRWLTLAANVGVLAGLVLVSLQIRQNTAITRAQIENDYFLADMQLELTMMGEDPAASWVAAVYAPDELTARDAAVVDRYFNYGLVQVQRLQRMNELGLADDEWVDRIDYLRWHLGNEVGRRWWEHSRDSFPAEFVATVEASLSIGEFRGNQRMLDALLARETPER
jgi:hypothetical protein